MYINLESIVLSLYIPDNNAIIYLVELNTHLNNPFTFVETTASFSLLPDEVVAFFSQLFTDSGTRIIKP